MVLFVEHLKDNAYQNNSHTIDKLKVTIRVKIKEISYEKCVEYLIIFHDVCKLVTILHRPFISHFKKNMTFI